MEDFECKAPMYFNFSETTALDESDGADKFFECEADDDSGNCDDDDDCSVMSEPVQFVASDSDGAIIATIENMSGVLSHAIRNLCTISKQKKTCVSGQLRDVPNSAVRKTLCGYENNQNLDKTTGKQKFVSIAEAVQRFHLGTPDRFHSKPKIMGLQNANQQRRGSWGSFRPKLPTFPKTPQLTSHLRSRPVTYMTREQEEENVLAKMKTYKIKANPLNPKVLEPPKPKGKVEKKPPTKQMPFNLTEIKKKKPESSPAYIFTARPAPKKILEKIQGVPEKKELPVTDPVTPKCVKRSKVYATAVDVKDGVKCFTEKEVHHFGIPTVEQTEWKRPTEVKPFSFEERDKQFLKRREEAIQKHLEQEKKNREFHAKPLPSCINTPNQHKDLTIVATKPMPFRLSVDKRGMTKQEQLKKKLEEEERALKEIVQFKARPATVILKKPFEPKKADRPLTDITAVELNTEKRAKEREMFDLKVKLEQAELEELRKLRDEEQKRKEMEEVAKFRKEAVHKAKPIPKFKTIEVLSSSKPLTSPKSPAFTSRSRSNVST